MGITTRRAGLLMLWIAVAGVVYADDLAKTIRDLHDQQQQTIVTVKFVMKADIQGQTREIDHEVDGVMIGDDGLILVSSTALDRGARRQGIAVNFTDMKVMIGDDTEGVDARQIAHDSDLDLAWIKIDEPREAGYEHVDFSGAVEPEIGDRLLAVQRMGKFFDKAIVVDVGRLGGKTERPRHLYVPTGTSARAGTAIYSTDGKPIGMMVLQMPEPEEMESASRGDAAELLLSGAQIVQATKRARMTLEPTDQPEAESQDADAGDASITAEGDAD